MKKLNDLLNQEIEEIVALSMNNVSRKEISNKYDISISTIRTICSKHNVQIRASKQDDDSLKDDFIKLVEEGLPRYKIAKQLNISERRVTSLAKTFNINLKSSCSGKRVDINTDLLRKLYQSKDHSLKDIAMILKAHPATIAKKAKELNLEFNGSTAYITPYEKEVLKDLYINQNKTINEIAKILSQQEPTIEKKLWMLKIVDKLPKSIKRSNMPYDNEEFMNDYSNPYISHASIEKKYGISASTVAQWRKRDFGKGFLQGEKIVSYNTSYELKVKEILEELDVAYMQQKQIGPYKVDFYLGNKTCIECDGLYYHDKKSEHDSNRKLYLKENGYYCLHLTDTDFIDLENTKHKINNILECRLRTKLQKS